jgi:hypothetical protein
MKKAGSEATGLQENSRVRRSEDADNHRPQKQEHQSDGHEL